MVSASADAWSNLSLSNSSSVRRTLPYSLLRRCQKVDVPGANSHEGIVGWLVVSTVLIQEVKPQDGEASHHRLLDQIVLALSNACDAGISTSAPPLAGSIAG